MRNNGNIFKMQFFKGKKYVLDFPDIPVERPCCQCKGHRFAAKIPYNVQHSKKKKKKTRSQSRYQTTEEIETVIYVVGIDDLLIKYKYALFIILKANLIKIPKIT